MGGAAAAQVLYLSRPLPFLRQHVLIDDDVYYYLRIARNLWRLHWVTFDGVHASSGVQLLWTAILAGLAPFFDDRVAFIRAVLLLCVLLNLGAGLLLRRFGRLAHSRDVGETIAILWAIVMVPSSTTLTGMEYSLHLALIAGTLLLSWPILTSREVPMTRVTLLAIVCTLNFWTRLDSALFSVAVLLAVSVRLLIVDPVRVARKLGMIWSVPLAGAGAYAATCYAMAGTVTPISGLVKEVYAARHFAGYPRWVALAGHLFWWGKIQALPVMSLISAVTITHAEAVSFVMLAAAGVVAIAATAWGIHRVRGADARTRRFASLLGFLWVLSAIHAAILVTLIGHFAHVTQHYFGLLMVTWCAWASVLLYLLLDALPHRIARTAAETALGVVAVVQLAGVAVRLRVPANELALTNVRAGVIDWANQHLPPGQPVAAWNAGQVGYFMNRPVVGLDGLVNDRSFLQGLRRGEPITDYLRQEGIRYVIDYDYLDLTMPYRASWDRTRTFRNQILWTQVDRILERHTEDRVIYVLRLKDWQ